MRNRVQICSDLCQYVQIYVRSTDLNRILASAQAVMAGLFGTERLGLDIPSKQNSSTWPSHWIPVPVHAPVSFFADRVFCINI